MKNFLQSEYSDRVIMPKSLDEIPRNKRLVYILTYNNSPIVLGQGKYNRAKVIFDDLNRRTTHIKAIFVRAYQLYGDGSFERFIIECKNEDEAQKIEKDLHVSIGGNERHLPSRIVDAIFKDLDSKSRAYMVLNMALNSSFCGLSDLRTWRRKEILDDEVWAIVAERLKLEDPLR